MRALNDAPVLWTGAALFVQRAPLPQAASARGFVPALKNLGRCEFPLPPPRRPCIADASPLAAEGQAAGRKRTDSGGRWCPSYFVVPLCKAQKCSGRGAAPACDSSARMS